MYVFGAGAEPRANLLARSGMVNDQAQGDALRQAAALQMRRKELQAEHENTLAKLGFQSQESAANRAAESARFGQSLGFQRESLGADVRQKEAERAATGERLRTQLGFTGTQAGLERQAAAGRENARLEYQRTADAANRDLEGKKIEIQRMVAQGQLTNEQARTEIARAEAATRDKTAAAQANLANAQAEKYKRKTFADTMDEALVNELNGAPPSGRIQVEGTPPASTPGAVPASTFNPANEGWGTAPEESPRPAGRPATTPATLENAPYAETASLENEPVTAQPRPPTPVMPTPNVGPGGVVGNIGGPPPARGMADLFANKPLVAAAARKMFGLTSSQEEDAADFDLIVKYGADFMKARPDLKDPLGEAAKVINMRRMTMGKPPLDLSSIQGSPLFSKAPADTSPRGLNKQAVELGFQNQEEAFAKAMKKTPEGELLSKFRQANYGLNAASRAGGLLSFAAPAISALVLPPLVPPSLAQRRAKELADRAELFGFDPASAARLVETNQ